MENCSCANQPSESESSRNGHSSYSTVVESPSSSSPAAEKDSHRARDGDKLLKEIHLRVNDGGIVVWGRRLAELSHPHLASLGHGVGAGGERKWQMAAAGWATLR